jgi:hypothetical protein
MANDPLESSHIPVTGLHDHNAGRAMLSAGAKSDQAHHAGCRRCGAKAAEELFQAVKDRRRQIETREATHRAL